MTQSGDWNLLFSDDFDGTSLDTDKWTTCYWWDEGGCTNLGNDELEWYQPDDVLVSDGTLKLRAQERTTRTTDGEIYHYTSGMITTGRNTNDTSLPAKFTFQFGYAEMRARIPSGQGLWPAFWLLPATHDSKPEIDVMEIKGQETDTIHMHFHYLTDDGEHIDSGDDWTGPDFSADWHTFAVSWQPDGITWYVDGIARRSYTDTAHVPAEQMYLIANLAIGGEWPGPPDASTPFPSYYEIDYVRVWKRSSQVYLTPTADTFVEDTYPSTNFGSSSSLYVDANPIKVSYLKFDSTFLAGRSITSAKLRVKTTSDTGAGSSNRQDVKLVNDAAWNEDTLTFLDKPVVSSSVLGSISNALPDTTYEIPLDISLLQPEIGGLFSLALDSTGHDGFYFYSKENISDNPQLIVTVLYYRCMLPLILK
jgi:beta-glucanase (GH16 family)